MGFFENLKKDFSQAVSDLLQKDAFLTDLEEELSDLEDIETQKSLANIRTKELFTKDEQKKQLASGYGAKCFGEENLFVQEVEENLNLDIEEIFLEPNMQPEPLVGENIQKEVAKQEKSQDLSLSEKQEITDEKKIDTNEILIKKEVLNDENVNNKKEEVILEKEQEENKEEMFLEKEKMIKIEKPSFQKNAELETVAETSQRVIEVVKTEQLLEEDRAVVNSEKTFQKPIQRNNIEVVKSEKHSQKSIEVVRPDKWSQKPIEVAKSEKRFQKSTETANLDRRSQKSTEAVNLEKRSQKVTGIVKLEERFQKNTEVRKPQEAIQKPIEVENRASVNRNRKMKKTRQRTNIEKEVSVLEKLTTEEINTFDKLLADTNLLANDKKEKLEDEKMARFETRGTNSMDAGNVDMDYIAEALNEEEDDISDMMEEDVTIIAKGTKVVGNISSESSLEIDGTVMGDIECLGRLSVRGYVAGNSSATEIYVNASRLDGNLSSEGIVKVEAGTVVIGDIEATSAVVAGAVKGEIDINGPITIDSTAIIKGNIKAKSIQINNGAVVDGHCALAYSTVDIDSYFGKGTTAEVKQPVVAEQQPVKVNEPKKEKNNK